MPDATAARRAPLPFAGVAVWSGLLTLDECFLAYHGLEPSVAATYLYNLGLAWLLFGWLYTDHRSSRYWPCYDYDWFMLMMWPVLLPHYLVKTRGKRGLLPFLAIIALSYLLPTLCAAIVAQVVAGTHR